MLIDTNSWGSFLKKTDDSQPIHSWIDKGGRLVYSDHKKIKKEMGQLIKKFSQSRKQAGSSPLKIIPEDKLELEMKSIEKTYQLKSNDSHILALAKVGKAKLLYSKDEKLRKDFSKIIKGKIYQNKSHSRLLNKYVCPE